MSKTAAAVAATLPMFLRSGFPFNYDTNKAGDEAGLSCGDISLAVQSSKDESDINVLVKRFGIVTVAQAPDMSKYGDFTGVDDYQSALHAVMAAEAAFNDLPAELRSQFDNDPGAVLDFLADENNRDEAISLGLIPKPVTPPPGDTPTDPVEGT